MHSHVFTCSNIQQTRSMLKFWSVFASKFKEIYHICYYTPHIYNLEDINSYLPEDFPVVWSYEGVLFPAPLVMNSSTGWRYRSHSFPKSQRKLEPTENKDFILHDYLETQYSVVELLNLSYILLYMLCTKKILLRLHTKSL